MQTTVTLKDISIATGVSLTTVHRAINNKEGITESLRNSILSKADEMGYKPNYAASSLTRKTIHIGIVFPCSEGIGQFYYTYFWKACRDYIAEVSGLNVKISEFPFSGDGDEQVAVLDKIYRQHSSALDGLLTVPLTKDPQLKAVIEKFTEKDISVVFIDNDIPGTEKLCCISSFDTSTGRLGAELLTSIVHKKGKVLVAAGSNTHYAHIHNLRGFKSYLEEQQANLDVHEVFGFNHSNSYEITYQAACNFLKTNSDVVAFYSVTARETLPLCQAVIDCGFAGKLVGVGSDLYPESIEMLKNHTLNALIYKNPYDKAYRGLKTLFEALVKKKDPIAPKLSVPISVVMNSNLQFFEEYL